MQFTIILLAALLTFGGRLAGTWTGSISQSQSDGTLEGGSAYLQLQEQGDQITGSVGPSSDNAYAIERASFSGDTLTFSTHYVDPTSNEPVTWSFNLRVNGNAMEGTGTGRRGDHSWTVVVKLARRRMAAQRMQPPTSHRVENAAVSDRLRRRYQFRAIASITLASASRSRMSMTSPGE